mmetsp:Transcript_148935/g.415005  ORF Transcript_148935/g.415005 Transcript_148935/m.415005 type:complete len:86 (+) Transcript_148935:105-362(+)
MGSWVPSGHGSADSWDSGEWFQLNKETVSLQSAGDALVSLGLRSAEPNRVNVVAALHCLARHGPCALAAMPGVAALLTCAGCTCA